MSCLSLDTRASNATGVFGSFVVILFSRTPPLLRVVRQLVLYGYICSFPDPITNRIWFGKGLNYMIGIQWETGMPNCRRTCLSFEDAEA